MNSNLDCFGKDTAELKDKRLFLFDMDGTIYNEDTLFDGTIDLLNIIQENGGFYVFITNNSSKSILDYVNKLSNMSISVRKENFFTSTQAAILLLKRKFRDELIYCQGTRSFVNELLDSGINAVTEINYNAKAVLIGFDTELTSQKIRNTCEMLQMDIPYYATNPDLVCPVSFGFIPDCGSICGMIKNAVGKTPIYIGKPQPIMIDTVIEKFKVRKDESVIIGDRLYTDIASGINAGITSVCVLTGETSISDIKTKRIYPTFTFNSVKDIYQTLNIKKGDYVK